MALLYRKQGKYEEAEQFYHRILHIREQQLGSEHPEGALSLNGLANLYNDQGKYAEAEPLYQQALIIAQESLGVHPMTIMLLENYVFLLHQTGQRKRAKELKQLIQQLQKALS